MRPVPRRRHHLAVLILTATAIVGGIIAMRDDRLSESQIYIATAAAKHYQSDLFPHDPVYGASRLWRLYSPMFLGMLDMLLAPGEYRDLTLPFRLMAPAALLVYLLGMYALLYRQCRSWSIATFIAILSATIIYTVGQSYWGVGSLPSITPWTLCLCLSPMIVLSYLRYFDNWRLLLVFLVIGLIGNVHIIVAMNLAVVLLSVYLGRHRFRPQAWPMAIGCLGAVVAGALPYLSYAIALRLSGPHQAAHAGATAIYEAFRIAKMPVLYPDLLESALNWIWVVLLGLIVPAAVVLFRFERFRVRDAGVWMWFIASALFAAFALHGAIQFVSLLLGEAPPVIDLVQAASLVMLPLYMLLAQGLTSLFRIGRGHRTLLRWGCVVMMVLWLAPSDNFRCVRYALVDSATMFMSETDKPHSVQRHHQASQEHQELQALCNWVCLNNEVKPDAVFITDMPEVRMLARRSVVTCPQDVKFYYYLRPGELDKWVTRVNEQKSILHPPAGQTDPQAVLRYVDKLEEDDFREVSEWYVILPASAAPADSSPLKEVKSDDWGPNYRLYQLP